MENKILAIAVMDRIVNILKFALLMVLYWWLLSNFAIWTSIGLMLFFAFAIIVVEIN